MYASNHMHERPSASIRRLTTWIYHVRASWYVSTFVYMGKVPASPSKLQTAFLSCACLIVWMTCVCMDEAPASPSKLQTPFVLCVFNCMDDMRMHGWGACGYEYVLCVIARMASICMGNASGRICMLLVFYDGTLFTMCNKDYSLHAMKYALTSCMCGVCVYAESRHMRACRRCDND
jgi:hypothetical protein